jgi:hypothetical protein
MPDYIVAALVSVLFAFFGLQSLFFNDNEQGSEIQEKSGHNLFLTTFKPQCQLISEKTVHSNNVIKLAGFFSTKFDRQ